MGLGVGARGRRRAHCSLQRLRLARWRAAGRPQRRGAVGRMVVDGSCCRTRRSTAAQVLYVLKRRFGAPRKASQGYLGIEHRSHSYP